MALIMSAPVPRSIMRPGNHFKHLKRFLSTALSALMMVGSMSVSLSPVHADDSMDSTMYGIVSELVGGTPITDGSYVRVGTYGATVGDTWQQVHDRSASSMRSQMDCTRSASWLLTHWLDAEGSSMSEAGINPNSAFFMGSGVANMLRNSKFTEYTDLASARAHQNEPGMYIIYGTGSSGHVSLTLGNGYIWDYTVSGYRIRKGDINATEQTSFGSGTEAFSYAYQPTEQPKHVRVEVNKSSTKPEVTTGNDNYDLSGAVYGVYDSENGNQLATMTTDKTGYASSPVLTVKKNVNTLYVHEIQAPANFGADQTWHPVDVSSGEGAVGVAYSQDAPDNDPISIVINKKSEEGSIITNDKAASLKGAQFTIKYYPKTYDSVSAIDMQPQKTWIIATQKQPDGSYAAALDDAGPEGSYLVPGSSDLDKDSNGYPVVYYGTITIEETHAPEGYITDGSTQFTLSANGTKTDFSDKTVLININEQFHTNGGTTLYVRNFGDVNSKEFQRTEKTARGGFSIDKQDLHLGKDVSGDSSDLKATFSIVNKNDYTVSFKTGEGASDIIAVAQPGEAFHYVTKTDDGTVTERTDAGSLYTVQTDKNGNYKSYEHALQTGNYTLHEEIAPTGYAKADDVDFTVGLNVSTTVTVKDEPLTLSVSLQKSDVELANPKVQGDAEDLTIHFNVRNDSAHKVWIKDISDNNNGRIANPGEFLFKNDLVTDKNGNYKIPDGVIPYGTYDIVETKAPTGYNITWDGTAYKTSKDAKAAGATVYKGTQSIGFNTHGTKAVSTEIKNEVKHGSFSVKKYDTNLKDGKTEGDMDLTTTFCITNDSKHEVVVQDKTYQPGAVIAIDGKTVLTTDKDGNYQSPSVLPYGTYTVHEVQAPVGMSQSDDDRLEMTFSIRDEGQNAAMTNYDGGFKNTPVTGTFTIYKHYDKHDRSEWDDAPEKGATFLAILQSDLEKNWGKDVKADATTGQGEDHSAIQQAYKDITAIIGEDHKADGDVNDPNSEAGQLYAKYGLTPNEFSIITTGDDGRAQSNGLVYGTYLIHQVGGDKNYYINDDTAAFKVDGNPTPMAYSKLGWRNGKANILPTQNVTVYRNSDDKLYSATNNPLTYQLVLYKYDEQTGKRVTLNGASFKLVYDHDNNGKLDASDYTYSHTWKNEDMKVVNGYVLCSVGDKWYDVFRTYSQATDKGEKLANGTFVIDTASAKADKDVYGSTVTPAEVVRGNYFVVEADDSNSYKATPAGYVTANTDTMKVNGSNYKTSGKDQNWHIAGEVKLSDTQYTRMDDNGTPTVFSDDKYYAYDEIQDTRALGELTVKKTIEAYTADKTLINRKDLSGFGFELRAAEDIIDPADGSVITKKGELASSLVDGKYVVNGAFHVDKDGNYVLSNIPLGKYILTEVTQPDGTVKNDKKYEVNFIQGNDRSTKVFKQEIKIENLTTKVSVSKQAVTGQNELAGAQLQITDKSGNVIDSWTSTDKQHTIEGLTAGETYTLTETIAPDGYVRASSIDFVVNKDNKVKTVKMIDKIVSMTKVDMGGKEVEGAKMTVTDESGKVVDAWTSGKEAHHIKGLDAGKTYVLHEDTAPAGYAKATDITFTVKDDNKNQSVSMTDKQVAVKKVDMCGTAVEGAELTVYDKNGKEVDKWTVDKTGSHYVNNLQVGESYTVKETKVPDGYVKAADYSFTVTDDGKNQTETIVDKQVKISKTDLGGKELEGAKLTVKDGDGKVVDSWTSGKTTHYVTGLEVGKTYTLSEDTAPLGYVKSTDVKFTVSDDGVDQKVTMVDTVEAVEKVDEDGKAVTGAVMEIRNSKDEVVDTWTSGQHIVDLSKEEVAALKSGYETTVTTKDGKSIRIVPLADAKKSDGKSDDKADSLNKVESQTCDIKKAEAGKTDDSAKTAVKNATHYQAVITDKDGNVSYANIDLDGNETSHMVSGLTAGEKYTVHEVSVPDGYYYAEDSEITAPAKKDETTDVVDQHTDYLIEKIDDKNQPVEGVTLTLTDITDEKNPVSIELPNKGVTTKDPFELKGVLIAGHKYQLEETNIVNGYYAAQSMEFTVDEHVSSEDPIKITMVDATTDVSVLKVDEDMKPVAGAKMSVIKAEKDKDGNIVASKDENGSEEIVYEFTSTDDEKGTDISKYVEGGASYILREDEAPFGFNVAKETAFTVTGGMNQAQVLVVKDTRKTVYVSVKKVDATDKTKTLAGAEFTILNPEGKIVRDVNGNPCKAKTGKDGIVTFEISYRDNMEDGGYTVRETGAPKGYKLDGTAHKVTFTSDYEFSKANPVVIEVEDTPKRVVVMGVSASGIAGAVGIAAAAAFMLVVVLVKKHKGGKKED